MSGLQLADTAQPRAIAGNVLQGEIGVDRVELDLAAYLGQSEQRFELRGEGERSVGQTGPEQRLLAQPVARQDEPFAAGIPEGDREHPVQARGELRSALLVEVRQHRGVACAAHLVRAQLVAQHAKVVRLAVEDGDHVARLVGYRLVAGIEVDHLQPLMAEHAMAEDVGRAFIRSTMHQCGAHRVHALGIRHPGGRIESGDAAHGTHTARAVRGRLVSCGAAVGRRGLEALQRTPRTQAGRVRGRCPDASAGRGR